MLLQPEHCSTMVGAQTVKNGARRGANYHRHKVWETQERYYLGYTGNVGSSIWLFSACCRSASCSAESDG